MLVEISRATVIDVADPLDGADRAAAWLKRAGEADVAEGLAVLNRALHAHRIATTDPYAHGVSRADALVTRVGYGAGEQVADGQWADAREVPDPGPRRRRMRIPAAQGRLAALLTGRHRSLGCEELALRARADLDAGRESAASLQLRIAFEAALAELPADPTAPALGERIDELRGLHATLAAADREGLAFALGRLEAALRARVAALPQ
jgi:hypothetical protein